MTPKATQLLLAGALLLIAGTAVQAQQVYRIVGPDGRVTYSDKPPAEPSRTVAAPGATPGGLGGASGTLPFTLRQVVNRYPVTLYTGTSCSPCGSARNLLTSRGVPFSERTVTTGEDGEALQRLSGDTTLPFLTIGSQQLKGFSDVEWSQFLDAAGYPKSSQLPAGYRNVPPAPLVALQRPATPAAPAPAAEAAPAPATPAATPENPNGIRF